MPQWNAVEWILRRLPEFHLLPVANDSFHFVFIVDPVKGLGCREIWKTINDKLLGLIVLLFVNIWGYLHKLLKSLKQEWCAPPPPPPPPPQPSTFFLFLLLLLLLFICFVCFCLSVVVCLLHVYFLISIYRSVPPLHCDVIRLQRHCAM